MREGQKFAYRTVHINKFKKAGQARVQDDAQLEKSLGKKLYNAHCELAQALLIELGQHGYPHEASFIEKIPTTGSYEYSVWITDKIEILNRWRDTCSHRLHRAVVFDICVRGLTIKGCARERSMGRKTIRKYLREALNEWSKLRGWGDQLIQPAKVTRTKHKKPQQMIDLTGANVKIIIYEE